MKRLLFTINKTTMLCFIYLGLFTSCNEQTTSPEDSYQGSIDIALDMSDAPSEVSSLSGTLTRNREQISFDFTIRGNSARASVENIPAGNWLLRVDAYDVNDQVIYTGTAEITIESGVETEVSLHLNPAGGSLLITVTWGDHDDDRFEENDYLRSAASLTEYTYYDDLIIYPSDDDWYEMRISADSLSIQCIFDHGAGDINIDLVDGNGTVLATSQSLTDNEYINHIVNTLDSYYIHVYQTSGSSNTYTIWWDDIWQGEGKNGFSGAGIE